MVSSTLKYLKSTLPPAPTDTVDEGTSNMYLGTPVRFIELGNTSCDLNWVGLVISISG